MVAEKSQHILFSSNDHVVFIVVENQSGRFIKVPQMMDLSTEVGDVCVELSGERHLSNCQTPTGHEAMITVTDSAFDDVIIGNDQSNFLSCSGGIDFLLGGKASDTYVVKNGCKRCIISNFDNDEKSDLLFIEETFRNLKSTKSQENLIIR